MVPTLIVFGVVFGRWWRFALAAGAFGWPLVLLFDHTIGGSKAFIATGLLALLNTGVGVLLHQVVLRGVHRRRQGSPATAQ